MARLLKYTLGLLSALITAAIISVVLLVVLVKPAYIKTKVNDWVNNNTNRELTIEGPMHWTFFPTIGLTADDVSLSNPKNFDSNNFAKAKHMTISLKVAPLLHKEFAISSLRMNQLVLNLVKNSNGKNNWSFEHKKETTHSQPTTQSSTPTNVNETGSTFEVKLHDIIFTDSTIVYLDKKTGQRTELSKLALQSSNFKPAKPFTITSNFTLNKANDIALSGKVQYDTTASNLTVEDFELSSTHSDSVMSTFSIHTSGEVNFNKETLDFSAMKFEYANELTGTATLKGSQILHKANINGDISTNNFNLKKLLNNLGTPINTVNKSALSSVKIDGKLSVSSDKIIINKMKANIDDMSLSGDISYQLSPAAIVLDLVGDTLNVDYYAMRSGGSHKNKNTSSSKQSKSASSAPTPIKGSLQFKTVKSGKVHLANVKTRFNYQNNKASLSPFAANIFDGYMSGTITVNTQGNAAYISLNQSLKNINIDQLLLQTTGSAKISGRANIQANLNFSSAAAAKTLSGSTTISSSNGTIRGTDIDYEFAKQLSKIGSSRSTGRDRGYTPYKQLNANINFGGGTLSNNSLSIDLENYHIKGDGKLNMINRGLNYNLGVKPKKPTEVKTQVGSTELSQYYIPLKITGTTDNPNIMLDFSEVLKLAIKKQAQQLFEKQVKDKIEDKIRDKIKDQNIGDVLKRALPF